MPIEIWNNLHLAVVRELQLQAFMALDAMRQADFHLEEHRKARQSMEAEYNKPADPSENPELRHARIQKLASSTSDEAKRFFRNINSFVICHANISKLIRWDGQNSPAQYRFPGNEEERAQLSSILNFLKAGLLTFDLRNLRNHLEHYDERLIHTAYGSDITFFRLQTFKQER